MRMWQGAYGVENSIRRTSIASIGASETGGDMGGYHLAQGCRMNGKCILSGFSFK